MFNGRVLKNSARTGERYKMPARNTRLKQEQSHLEAQIADGRPSGREPVIEILSHLYRTRVRILQEVTGPVEKDMEIILG